MRPRRDLNQLKRSFRQLKEELEWEEERLDEYYSQRDVAIGEGKFDQVAELNRSIRYILDHKDSLQVGVNEISTQIQTLENLSNT